MTFRLQNVFVALTAAALSFAILAFFVKQTNSEPKYIAVQNGRLVVQDLQLSLMPVASGHGQHFNFAMLAPYDTILKRNQIFGESKLELQFKLAGKSFKHVIEELDYSFADTVVTRISEDGSCSEAYWND